MNLAELKEKENKTAVHIRLPLSVRKKAKAIARQQQVSESFVYRVIIEKYLPEVDTKSSTNPLQDVGKGGEPS